MRRGARPEDSIITGGLNVYPAEVEAALIKLDGVLDCAAYGVPDEKWGEAVAASVVLAPATLPRTASGKILLRVLRARFTAPRSAPVPPGSAPARP